MMKNKNKTRLISTLKDFINSIKMLMPDSLSHLVAVCQQVTEFIVTD